MSTPTLTPPIRMITPIMITPTMITATMITATITGPADIPT